MRRSVIIVLVLLALVASMGCAATTVAPKAIAPKVRAPVIATVSTIANGEVAPTIVVTITVMGGVESVFRPGLLASDLTVFPATGLTLGTVTYVSATQIAVAFTGAAEGGEVTIIANPSAFTPVAAAASNDMTVDISVPEVTAPVAPIVGDVHDFVIEIGGIKGQKFSGSYDTVRADGSSTSRSVEGVIPATIDVNKITDAMVVKYTTRGDIVSCVFQLQQEVGVLVVRILQDGTEVEFQYTSAAYGVVTVATP